MMLTQVEREHHFLLGLGRPPEVRYQAPETVTPRLQRVLDAFEMTPAYVKTSTWDVIGWNFAASVVLTDYSKMPPGERNILRHFFRDPRVRKAQTIGMVWRDLWWRRFAPTWRDPARGRVSRR
jgi:hypothetical protein